MKIFISLFLSLSERSPFHANIIPLRIFQYSYNVRSRATSRVSSSSSRKEHPIASGKWRAIKINIRVANRIDLLFAHDLHRRNAYVRGSSVRYARVHVNDRRGYRARGSKLKLKRSRIRESFPVSTQNARSTHCIPCVISLCVFTVRCIGTCSSRRAWDHRYLAAAVSPQFFALTDLSHASIFAECLIKRAFIEEKCESVCRHYSSNIIYFYECVLTTYVAHIE